jgi:cell wall-associated NlpC family hydrolase
LLPGDLLTFSKKPGSTQVTHIGMYVGDGRFIHSSSSKGVRESAPRREGPDGPLVAAPLVGARRVLGY